MTIQNSTAVRNARADAWEATIGTSPTIEVRTGAPPANCAAADIGTLLATFSLGSDWASAASGGVKALSGLPISATVLANGAPGHYRLKSSGGTCHEQGAVTVTDGGGDLEVDSASVTIGQDLRLLALTTTEAGA